MIVIINTFTIFMNIKRLTYGKPITARISLLLNSGYTIGVMSDKDVYVTISHKIKV